MTETYTITYDSNGGTGTMSNATATHGTVFTLPDCGFAAPSSKIFKEWAIGSVDSDAKVTANGTHSFTADTTVYAVWESITIDPVKYEIINGQGSEWNEGATDGLEFTAVGDHGTFTGVLVNGAALSSDMYTSKSGSTIVTLKAEYLKTLSVGQHTLRINFTDGYAETHFNIKSATNPTTGDSSQLLLGLCIVALSANIVLARKKRQNG